MFVLDKILISAFNKLNLITGKQNFAFFSSLFSSKLDEPHEILGPAVFKMYEILDTIVFEKQDLCCLLILSSACCVLFMVKIYYNPNQVVVSRSNMQ